MEVESNKIYIDYKPENYSIHFNNFFKNYFISSWGLIRNEVDLSFFIEMSNNEKEIAKKLLRDNLPYMSR